MSAKPQWSLRCSACGESRGVFHQWRKPTTAKWPCECGASLRRSRWVASAPIESPRLSGFSSSESDFTPHWSSAFHQPVRSLAQMRALQEASGCEDAVVKGDGAERHCPRDIGTRLRHHRDFREKIDSGKPFETGKGVKVELLEKGSDE